MECSEEHKANVATITTACRPIRSVPRGGLCISVRVLMVPGTELIAGCAALVTGLGLLESRAHRHALARISTRVHVNGTRGKSSVTRLIAAGLRQGGMRVCAKTTGSLPRFVLPDGLELPIMRRGRPNIMEQKRIVRLAADLDADALVIECMALQPELQALSEDRLVRATHGVVTNARPDHLDVMGPTAHDVALALAATTPWQGILFTAERDEIEVFRRASNDRSSTLVAVDAQAVQAVGADDLQPFSYTEHPDNVALSLAVCEALGVDRRAALQGMWACRPDPGAFRALKVRFYERELVFFNGFAANDPVSTLQLWNIALRHSPDCKERIALVNCRRDRPDRSTQLGEALAAWPHLTHVVVIGDGPKAFVNALFGADFDPTRLSIFTGRVASDVFEDLLSVIERKAMIVGIGNIAGIGLDLVRYFANRSTASTSVIA